MLTRSDSCDSSMMMDGASLANLRKAAASCGGGGSVPATPRKASAAPTPTPTGHAANFEGAPSSRFQQDFELVGIIGSGTFGRVMRARMRLDGCEYAVKSMLHRFKGKADRSR